MSEHASAPAPARPLIATPDDIRRAQDLAMFERQHATRDRLRAASPAVKVRAIVGFTIHDDPMFENGRVINPGDEIEVPEYDLDVRYKGRVMRILADGSVVPT